MIGKRLLGVAGAGVLVSFLGVLAACTSSEDQGKADAAETLRQANVAITLHDASGTAVGEGAGVLIAPRVVLTSAALVAGKAKWTIRTTDGKVVTGTRGLTKDWRVYDSMKAHPRRTDVAVIYLEKAIDLPAYPKLATARAKSGTEITRVRRVTTGFANASGKLERVRSFPNAYATEIPTSETLVTGGAVVNENFEIVGTVTGRGLTTGKLYVSRLDKVLAWLSPKVQCGGGAKLATALGTKTYGTPPPKPGCEKDGGTTSSTSSSSGGGAPGDGTDGTTSSSSGGGGGGTESSSGGPNGTCDDGGGLCSGDCSGAPGGTGTSAGDGANGGTSSSSSSGSTDTTSGGAPGTTSGGTPGGETDTGSSGSDGTPGSSSGGGGGAGDGTGTGDGTGAGGSDGTPDLCSGADSNPEVCPPEETGCSGPNCGGGAPDDLIDYGKCDCSVPKSTGTVFLR